MPYKPHNCVICIEDLQGGETAIRLPCLHVFHKTCTEAYFATTATPRCPSCRSAVPPADVPNLPTWTARIRPPPTPPRSETSNPSPPPAPSSNSNPPPPPVDNSHPPPPPLQENVLSSAAAAPSSRREEFLAAVRNIAAAPAPPQQSIRRRRRPRQHTALRRLRAALFALLREDNEDSDAELFPQPVNSTYYPFPPIFCRSLLTRRQSGAAKRRYRALRHPGAAHSN